MGLRFLPLRLLGTLASRPLASRSSTRGSPVLVGSTVPASASSGTREAGLGLPVSTSLGEAGLDGSGALVFNAGGLVLLDLLVSLGLRVAVCGQLLAISGFFLHLFSFRLGEKHTEVQIGHDVPGSLAAVDGATETEDLTGKEPPDGTNGVATLVVGRDGNVDVLGGRVGVAEGNDGDVDVAGLLDSLGVGAGVGDDNQARLLERAGDVVGEATGGEATGNGSGTGVSSELEDSTLAVGTGRDDANVGGVLDADHDTGSEDNLLPVAIVSISRFSCVCCSRHCINRNRNCNSLLCAKHTRSCRR